MPAVTRGSMGVELTDMAALAAAGAVGFTDDGKPVLDDGVMRAALVAAARVDRVVSQHAEDTRISSSLGMNAGAMAFRLGLRGMRNEAEWRLVERDLGLLRSIEKVEGLKPRLHVQHVSTVEAIDAIRSAKREGLRVTCEATPHHFALTEAAIGEYDTNAKMNPPLRAEADRAAVIEGLLDGTVDMIATDHAPHMRHEKEVEFERAPNGITGLETALGLAMRVLACECGATIAKVVTLMSTHPARLIGRSDLGTLRMGAAADVVVFDPDAEWHFRAAESVSRSRNTPFDGAAMVGRVRATVSGGAVVYRG